MQSKNIYLTQAHESYLLQVNLGPCYSGRVLIFFLTFNPVLSPTLTFLTLSSKAVLVHSLQAVSLSFVASKMFSDVYIRSLCLLGTLWSKLAVFGLHGHMVLQDWGLLSY